VLRRVQRDLDLEYMQLQNNLGLMRLRITNRI
jgi:hypothetical protein